jgi:hypothetical protein
MRTSQSQSAGAGRPGLRCHGVVHHVAEEGLGQTTRVSTSHHGSGIPPTGTSPHVTGALQGGRTAWDEPRGVLDGGGAEDGVEDAGLALGGHEAGGDRVALPCWLWPARPAPR